MITPDLNNITLDQWKNAVFQKNDIAVDVLRLDKIHPEISGNKWFKLKYYLEKAREEGKRTLLSYGGAYSNHLIALASAARIFGFHSVGIIRGDSAAHPSHTLLTLQQLGMELRFLSRFEYNQQIKSVDQQTKDSEEPEALRIPEGGAGLEGVRGAEEILKAISLTSYTHICCASGTGTTLAGIINGAEPGQKKIGVSVLKGTQNFQPLDISWIENQAALENVEIIHQYHFGGYAKKSQALIDFMNITYKETGIPTDFVYTGKLFYAITDLAKKKYFHAGSRLLILHTGGLQGNISIAPGLLQF